MVPDVSDRIKREVHREIGAGQVRKKSDMGFVGLEDFPGSSRFKKGSSPKTWTGRNKDPSRRS